MDSTKPASTKDPSTIIDSDSVYPDPSGLGVEVADKVKQEMGCQDCEEATAVAEGPAVEKSD